MNTVSQTQENFNMNLVSDDFSIGSIFSDAWNLTKIKGVKSGILISTILYAIVLSLLLSVIFVFLPINQNIRNGISGLIGTFIMNFVFIQSLRVIRGNKPNYLNLFNNINNLIFVILSMIVFNLVVFLVGFITMILLISIASKIFDPSIMVPMLFICIYLSFIFSLLIVLPLNFTVLNVYDKNYKDFLGIFDAMYNSASHILRHYFTYVLILIINLIILFVSVIPLCIPLIWTLPFMANTWPVAYQKEKF